MSQTTNTNSVKKVLQLKTSLFDGAGNEGVSTQLSGELLQGLHRIHGNVQLTTRDFSTDPVPYLDGAWLKALFTPAADRTQEQSDKVAYSDALIAELQATDVLVIGVPMYNFTVPAMLKSWTDHVARAGVTFKYTEKGAVGLVTGKKVYLVLALGGKHDEGVTDHMRPYLRTLLGFLGMTDIEIVVADGLNMGETYRAQGLQQARDQIQTLLNNESKSNATGIETRTELQGEAA